MDNEKLIEKVRVAYSQESCVVCKYKDGFETVKVVGTIVNIHDDEEEFEIVSNDNYSHVIRLFEVILLDY